MNKHMLLKIRRKSFLTQQGFTFVEVMLVISLIAVVGASLYSTFSSALKIWDRGNRLAEEENVLIFFEKIGLDLRNTVSFSLIPFEGSSDKISFATFVRTKADAKKDLPNNEYVTEIGRVEYALDPMNRQLFRRQGNYSQALSKKFFEERILLGSIKSVSFKYLYKTAKEFVFKVPEAGNIPSAVEIKIELGGNRPFIMTKIVDIPIGG